MGSSLESRRRVPELMDRPDLDPASHAAALRGLARLNALGGSAGMLWPPIAALARERRTGSQGAARSPLRLLDVATGSGDVPVRLALRARRRGVPLEIAGTDRSPFALSQARRLAERRGVGIELFEHDALAGDLPGGRFDIVTCSLFLHHLGTDEVVSLLAAMRRATSALVLINDLDRRTDVLALTWAATRVVTRSSVVRFDGPASVRAAFTPGEMAPLLARAGLAGAVIERCWPCRWRLLWRTPGS